MRWLTLTLAVALVSTGAVLVRLAAAPPLAVAFYRVALASLFVAPFGALPARRSWPRLGRRRGVLLIAAGLALAVHFATWIASLSFTSIASSVLLVNTAPLFTLALSRFVLREHAPRAVLVAVPGALLGAGLIAFADWTGSPGSWRGNLLALAGAATLAVYQVIGRGLRAALPLSAYVLAVWATASALLALGALAIGVPLAGYPHLTWLSLVALALVPTIGGHGLVNRSLRSLPAPTVSLFLLGEPVGASILAYFAFAEVPAFWTFVGGAIGVAALALVVSGRESAPPEAAAGLDQGTR